MRIRLTLPGLPGHQFSPAVSVSLIALLSFSLFIMLGLWQLERAELKREIEHRLLDQLQQPYQEFSLPLVIDESLAYRKIKLSGEYQQGRVILLDNQLYQSVTGYHVLMPFIIEGGDRAVLVNRGWVAAGSDRGLYPDIPAPKNRHDVRGIVTIPTVNSFRMGQLEMNGQWPQRVPFIDMQKIQQGLSIELLPYVIWQAVEMDDSLVRDWRPVWSSPEKSEAYALQWFSFALIVLFLFLLLNIKKRPVGDLPVGE